jgi:Protein of unknown function (DUF2490)
MGRMHPAHAWRRSVRVALLVTLMASFGSAVHAQTTPVWPEVDAFVTLTPTARLHGLATTVQENGESTEGELGVDVDLYRAPIRKTKPKLLFRLDESKNRILMVRVGYHYLPSYTGGDNENRGILEATARFPLIAWLGDGLLSSRSRVEFRGIAGDYSWRYRNRLSLEREFSIGPVRLNPYARFEAYYDSRFAKWSRTEWMAGSAFPITRHWEMELYFDGQLDTGGSSNRHTKALGAVVNLYF